jgi:hypothetical protein
MNVEVVTRDSKNPDAPPSIMIIDDTNISAGKWLRNHMWWAMRTNHSVTCYPTDKAVTWIDKTVKGVDRP